jgi:ABC-type arginine transport system ATPase subunit
MTAVCPTLGAWTPGDMSKQRFLNLHQMPWAVEVRVAGEEMDRQKNIALDQIRQSLGMSSQDGRG